MSVTLGPFELLTPLGRGGMGEVWRARHLDSGLPVAVKVLTAQRARSPSAIAAFRSEARAVASLDHPGIVRVLDHGSVSAGSAAASDGRLVADSPWLAMELASGGSIGDRGLRSWGELRSVIVALLEALAHAHARGVVHRDLKPGNILVCTHSDLRPGLKLTDFGIAFVADATEQTDYAGTPQYMAPEQIAGALWALGPWTDLYALGCTVWRLATGRGVFPGLAGVPAVHAQLAREPGPFEPLFPVPGGLEAWLRILLRKSHHHRFRCAADAAWALPPADAQTSAPRDPAVPGRAAEPEATTLVHPPQLGPAPPREGEPPPPPPFPASWHELRPVVPPAPLLGAGLGLYGLRDPPIVGQEAARDALWSALSRAAASRSVQVVAVTGPAGVGKTALCTWCARRAHELGAAERLGVGHAADAGESTTRLIRLALRCHGDDPEDAREAVDAHVGEGAPREEADALLDLLTGGPTSLAGAPRHRYATAARVLRRLTAKRPLVLHVDDAHHAADALGLVSFLLDGDDALPILVLLSVRDDLLPSRPEEAGRLDVLLSHPTAARVDLAPLYPSQQEQLVRARLALDEALVATVQERTAGNPLFAVQLVGDWVQRGLLVPSPTGFRLDHAARRDLPDDLYAVWRRRAEAALAGLPLVAAHLLELAATLGREVDEADWAALCRAAVPGCGGAAGQALRARLVDRLLDQRMAVPTDRGWSFVHDMLREAIERSAAEAGRLRAHHQACARLLGERSGGPALAIRLGRHLLGAGEAIASVGPLFEAAAALRQARSREALAVLQIAEDALRTAGVPEDDLLWFELWFSRERTHRHLGHDQACAIASDQAIALARRKGWRTQLGQALVSRAWLDTAIGSVDPSPHARLAEARALLAEDDANWRGEALLVEHELLFHARDYEGAIEVIDRYAVLAREAGDREAVLRAEMDRGNLQLLRGQLGDARRHIEQALRDWRELGHLDGQGIAYNSLGEIARGEGRLEEAERCYREALRMMLRTGSVEAAAMRINIGLVLLARDRFVEARAELVRALTTVRMRPHRSIISHLALATATAGAGDWAAFDHHLRQVSPLLAASEIADPDLAPTVERAGDLAEAAGERHRALQAWAIACDLWSRMDQPDDVERVERRIGGR